jgi:hypothetical protein
MKRLVVGLTLALMGAVVVAGCGGNDLRDGDTITPIVAGRPIWIAGQPGELQVCLLASGQDGSRRRSLDFSGIPSDANPKATITFYTGEVAQAPIHVTLDHRC